MIRTVIDRARQYRDELVAIRHDIYAHPELGLEEYRTADLVARKLEVHRGVGKTGVVGLLRNGNGDSAVCRYDFNDEAIPFGVTLYATIMEKKMPKAKGG
jgi:hypothetical protein